MRFKKLLVIVLTLCIMFTMAACGGGGDEEKAPSESEKKGGLQHESFDVNDFDASKFDGVIKIMTAGEKYNELKAPVKWSDLEALGYFLCDSEKQAEFMATAMSESSSGESEVIYYSDPSEDDGAGVTYYDLGVFNLGKGSNIVGDYVAAGNFCLSFGKVASSEINISEVINADGIENTTDQSDVKDLIKVLGVPSMVLGEENYDSGTYEYVYDYGDYVLVFEIYDYGDGDAFTSAFSYFDRESFDKYLETYTSGGDQALYDIIAQKE